MKRQKTPFKNFISYKKNKKDIYLTKKDRYQEVEYRTKKSYRKKKKEKGYTKPENYESFSRYRLSRKYPEKILQ